MESASRSLAEIAETSGFSMADVAFLAGLEESTVSRLWDDPEWLDRVKGRSLQALIGILPGVAEYVYHASLKNRRSRLFDELSAAGLAVNEANFRRLVTTARVPEQYLSNALEAASVIMSGDARKAAAYLMRFWGRVQDFALMYLFSSSGGILDDVTPLVDAGTAIAGKLAGRQNSFHAIIAQANLAHHLARVAGHGVGDKQPAERSGALTHRSGTIGLMMQTNDWSISDRYARMVADNHLLGLVEDWAFPTYTRDARPSQDFSLPRSLLLRNTADEIIREIDSYNDAYVHYLATTYLPRAVRRDATFGLRLADLRDALTRYLDRSDDAHARAAVGSFLKSIAQVGSNMDGSTLGHAW